HFSPLPLSSGQKCPLAGKKPKNSTELSSNGHKCPRMQQIDCFLLLTVINDRSANMTHCFFFTHDDGKLGTNRQLSINCGQRLVSNKKGERRARLGMEKRQRPPL